MNGVEDAPGEHETGPAPNEAERVIRHRKRAHEAALEIAGQLDRPDLLADQVEETQHRLAEDEDILAEITSDDGDGRT